MVNCTAAECQVSTGVVYGDYMGGIVSKIFIDSTDLSGVTFIKQRIRSFSAPIIV